MDRLNVVFTGGGTGGHLYPAIAIAQALGERANVTFIGARRSPRSDHRAERRLSADHGEECAGKTRVRNLPGVFEAMSALRRLRPDIVIATGGYVSLAGRARGAHLAPNQTHSRTIALLEPNARPGLTNRLLAPLVDEVWGAFPSGDPRFAGKYVQTGIPVRASLRTLPSRDAAIERLGLSSKRNTLLAMGGSQGARSINDALTSLLKSDGLPDGWQLIHVTGEKEYDRVRSAAWTRRWRPSRLLKRCRRRLRGGGPGAGASRRLDARRIGRHRTTGDSRALPACSRGSPARQRRDGRAGRRSRRGGRPRPDRRQAARRFWPRSRNPVASGICAQQPSARARSIRLRRFSPGSMRLRCGRIARDLGRRARRKNLAFCGHRRDRHERDRADFACARPVRFGLRRERNRAHRALARRRRRGDDRTRRGQPRSRAHGDRQLGDRSAQSRNIWPRNGATFRSCIGARCLPSCCAIEAASQSAERTAKRRRPR